MIDLSKIKYRVVVMDESGKQYNIQDYIQNLGWEENDSEIETVARDSLGITVGYVLDWYGIEIDIETAIRERDW